jgi:hypothetical protein
VRTNTEIDSFPSKRGRRVSSSVEIPLLPPLEPQHPARVDQKKPDTNMCLKLNLDVQEIKFAVNRCNILCF